VAVDLVGKILWRDGIGGGRLVEVEAYLPVADPACHGHRGLTPRNAALFGPPGTLYIFSSYGVHLCVNLVCYREGVGTAVLVRAFAPLEDATILRGNRNDREGRLPLTALAAGPGRVGQALGASKDWNGLPVGEGSGLVVLDDGERPPVEATPRIGLSRAVDLPLRFVVPGSAFLSRAPRRGVPVLPARWDRPRGPESTETKG
jgi:DNA-3-methyladenine glycosylase